MRPRALLATVLVALVGTAALPTTASAVISRRGVGGVKLGKTYRSLFKAGLIGHVQPGCELGGPNTRSAPLKAPLKGSVQLTFGHPRRVASITVTGGAAARGVRVGDRGAKIRRAYPRATFDHSTDATFLATFVNVPRPGGGRLMFTVSTSGKKRVTAIGIPFVAVCE